MHTGDAADAAMDKTGFKYPIFSDTVNRFIFPLRDTVGYFISVGSFLKFISSALTKHGLEWPGLAKQVHQMGRDTTCLSPATGHIASTLNQVKEHTLPLHCTIL